MQLTIHSQCHSVKTWKNWNQTQHSVRAQAYDLVLNGYELGGGSLRIFERDVQEKMFKVLGFTEEEANAQFGFLMDAFEYGTPPHGGIALGLGPYGNVACGSYKPSRHHRVPENSKRKRLANKRSKYCK